MHNPISRHKKRYAIMLLLLCLISTTAACYFMFQLLNRDGMDVLDVPIFGLFLMLFLWISIGFWTATYGFIQKLLINEQLIKEPIDLPKDQHVPNATQRTAIIMPIYNEDVHRVFAGLKAMYQSLSTLPGAQTFDFFVLSDTTDPDIWAQEEQAWAAMRQQITGPMHVYYRRRENNRGKKSGNVEDFCENWGSHYEHMIVLDADSIVTGPTMLKMASRMIADPKIGILQVPPAPVNRDSFFARLQQFSASVYGEMFTSGYALWTQTSGNYWGHNAIIRVKPFMEHCGLPMLPGQPPLGGVILSHDFVEAALMQRAGWKVVVASDLDGSYEESPTNLIDFAKRDQRWCQGNLQHLRLTVVGGLRPLSRVHLAMGVMSYAASPLWLIFMILTIIQTVIGHTTPMSNIATKNDAAWLDYVPLGLFTVTMFMLLIPKFWAFFITCGQPVKLHYLGGGPRLILGILIETLVSIIIAPVQMLFHSTFVIGTLLGHRVQWNAQNRSESGITWAQAAEAHASHTIFGLGMTLLLQFYIPALLPWAFPVLFGMMISIPMSVFLSSKNVGRKLRDWQLLQIPEESNMPEILVDQHRHLDRVDKTSFVASNPFIALLVDPALNHLHCQLLIEGVGTRQKAAENRKRLERIVVAGGPMRLSRDEKMDLLRDPQAVASLHREIWKDWPLEYLQV
jgi:membrane glycosyltransferase